MTQDADEQKVAQGGERGRPSTFTPAIGLGICARLQDGQGLTEICRDPALPSKTTVYRWLRDNADFRDQYAQAREVQADHLGHEILEIADDARNDWMERNDDGTTIANQEHIQRAKLRIDARKWLMSKLSPKKYGDRLINEHGGIGGDPIEVKHVTDIDRAKALAAMIAKFQASAPPPK